MTKQTISICDAPTAADIRAWPVTVDVVLAGRAFGIGRGLAYDLARRGEFPVPVRRIGTRYRVVTADILADLRLTAGNGNTAAGGAG